MRWPTGGVMSISAAPIFRGAALESAESVSLQPESRRGDKMRKKKRCTFMSSSGTMRKAEGRFKRKRVGAGCVEGVLARPSKVSADFSPLQCPKTPGGVDFGEAYWKTRSLQRTEV